MLGYRDVAVSFDSQDIALLLLNSFAVPGHCALPLEG